MIIRNWKADVCCVTLIFWCFLVAKTATGQKSKLRLASSDIPVFISGEEGYACFRIPAIIQTSGTDFLAFAEGRKYSCSDTHDIDLVMKRSMDYGKTWTPLKVLWDDDENTCGNPAPVFDQTTGDLFLLSTWNLGTDSEPEIIDQTSADTRRIYVMRSTDDGFKWSKPKEITLDVKRPDWTWYATGPGSGIQIGKGTFQDRLMVACDHIEAGTKKYYSHVIYSDDHGQSWQLGGRTPWDQVNECEIAELQDGRLILNMRNYDRSKSLRQIVFSENGGLEWKNQQHDSALIEPICQASLLSHRTDNQSILLFSNPASRAKRERMTVKLSTNDGKTWSDSLLIYQGPSAYSDLVSIRNNQIGCLYEWGRKTPYERIVLALISMED